MLLPFNRLLVVAGACLLLVAVPASAKPTDSVLVKHRLGCVVENKLPRFCTGSWDSKRSTVGAVTYRLHRSKTTARVTAVGSYRSRTHGAKMAWVLGVDLAQCTNSRGAVKEVYSREAKRVVTVRKGLNRIKVTAQVRCPRGYRLTYMETVGLSAYSPNFRARPGGIVTVDEDNAVNSGETVVIDSQQPDVDAYVIAIEDEFPSAGLYVDVDY